MDHDGVEVHNLAQNEWGQYPAILNEQAWSINYYTEKEHYFLVGHSGWDSVILPVTVANHNARFGSSWPLMELALWWTFEHVKLHVMYYTPEK